MKDWKSEYEDAADAELARYLRLPVAELLNAIDRGGVGEYTVIWSAIARRASPRQAGWRLFDFLQSDRPYLERYHCARALLQILQCAEFEPVALSANWPTLQRNLVRMREILEAAVGQRTT